MSNVAGSLAFLAHGQRVKRLYKTILKLHRGLPPDLAYMGDMYVKDEFKRHKLATPEQTVTFMESWAKYAITVTKQVGIKGPKTASGDIGTSLSFAEIDTLFTEEQLVLLFDLYKASTGIPEMNESKDNSPIRN